MINKGIPVTELHRHLDGNVRPMTIWELAEKNQISLPVDTPEALAAYVQIHDKTSDLLAFLKKLDTGVSVLASYDDCKRIAYENVEDAAKEGIDYIELRFSPYYMGETHGLSVEGVVEAVIDGIDAGMKAFNSQAKLIGILSRTYGSEICFKELSGLLAHKERITALDLAGDEIHYPAEQFVEHFKRGRDAGWQITVHAGEADGPSSIWKAINDLGAVRIGHGVAAIQDDKLMDYLAKHEIGIESCPTSNYQTATVQDTANHPMKAFLQRGIPVTLSTDDPGVSAIDLAHEYKVAKDVIGLTDAELAQIQKNGVEQAFLSQSEKKALYDIALNR
ncbi:adenosine deaminase [Alteromonas sediminis]|uniref:adenosine deaminase n=1 Tax=Alteromonas sediminis TaxID=2259342 RepID=A0A3N5Z943_9ALTE|nr:adenosine deaminase [Alteromonas sediminis]RPJ67474.1 adenosine deaminase [Alteromonas sediminis]